MELKEKTISSEEIFSGRILHIRRDTVELPGGGRSFREVVDHPGGVCVLALDDENRVLLVRQFRYPYEKVLTELPAGKLEIGEDPEQAALRELREERKLTQTALGAEIHISARMISFYESGNHFPKDEEALKRMAAFFQVSLDYLMGFSDLREEEPVRKLCAALRELPPGERKSLIDYLDYLYYRSERRKKRQD